MKELKRCLPFPNTCISSGDIQVWKMGKVYKWDDQWCHTLNPIIHHVYKLSYLGQFAAQIIETWQANSSTGNTPTAKNLLLPWQLTLFQSPPTWFRYVSDFQLEKRYTRPRTHEKHIYMLVGSCISGTICKYENWTPRVARNVFNIGEVWNPVCCHGNKSSNSGAHLVEFYCKESNISDTNWLRYLFSSYLIKTFDQI